MNKWNRNPAKHLYRFVRKAKSISTGSAAEGWAILLGTTSSDQITILSGIADINQLIFDAETAIKAQATLYSQDMMLEPIMKVKDAIQDVNLSNSWTSIINSFDESTIKTLRFCSEILEKQLSSHFIPESQINKWLSQIEDILKDVNSSDVPEDLKVFFMLHLERLRRALHQYWIFGISGIEVELERSIGAALIKRQEIRSCNDLALVNKIVSFVAALADAITVTEGVKAIAEFAGKLLQSG